MKLEFSRQIFEKYPNINFHENPLCGSRVVSYGRMDGQIGMMKLIVVFWEFCERGQKFGGLIATYHRQNPAEYNLHLTETAKY
jgi:hypothetical protein